MGWTRTDDIDGSAGAQQVVFAFDDKTYSIDLSEKNYAAFRETLAPFVEAASVIGEHLYDPEATAFSAPTPQALGETLTALERDVDSLVERAPREQRKQKTRAKRKPESAEPSIIREWARTNGYTVTDRGRIPAQVLAAYEEATA